MKLAQLTVVFSIITLLTSITEGQDIEFSLPNKLLEIKELGKFDWRDEYEHNQNVQNDILRYLGETNNKIVKELKETKKDIETLNSTIKELKEAYLYLKSKDVINSFPRGVILPWTNKDGRIPDGWAICDGTKGTPDLIGKFLMGGGRLAKIGESGGNNLISESKTKGHALTLAELPTHHHNTKGSLNGKPLHWGPGDHPVPTYGKWGNEKTRWETGGNKSHTHPLSAFDNRPEFFTVIFIMKL